MNPLSKDALNFLSLFSKGELDALYYEDSFTEEQSRGCRELIEKGIIVEVNMGFYKQIAEVERAGQSPAWTGLQADIARLTKENEELRACLKYDKSPCGHSDQFAHTEDGGKNIVCLMCRSNEVEELRKDKEILDWLEEHRLTHCSLTDAILIHVSKVETVRTGIRTAMEVARIAEESAAHFKTAMQQKGEE